MIAEIGHYALALALVIALAQSVVPLLGAARNSAPLMAMGSSAALGQFAFVALAFAMLMQAYVVSDFTVFNVVQNSHSTKPMLYKITGLWSNHEGSMLLWVFILSLFGALVAACGGNLPPSLRARVLSIQGMIGTAFLAFILFTSNPFLRVFPPPADGQGMNPVLQDPGLAFHPPILYLGYVGFSVAFSFAIAALIEGRVDAAWARWVRPWTLAAWCALTLGIALGSWWAYYELGWGGFWFWDPVENASLLPWLAGTALLHSAIVVEKRDALKSWTVLLAILAFVMSLIGTFLVRSGVLTSVHSFARDPERGAFILGILIFAAGGSLVLYAIRAPALKVGGLFAPISREGALVLNNLLLATACATVFLGTLYPLFLEPLGIKVSVGAPYFNATFLPLMTPALVVMVVAPLMAWKRADLAGALGRLKLAFLAAIVIAGVVFAMKGGPALALAGLAIAAWLVVGAFIDIGERIRLFRVSPADSLRRLWGLPRAAIGTAIAHGALGIVVAGITASSAWHAEYIGVMKPGESVEIAGYSVKLDSVGEYDGPNYRGRRAILTASSGGKAVATLTPEKRFFTVQKTTTTEAAIHTTWFADLYAVLGDPSAPQAGSENTDGGWVIRIYHNPLVPWIWIGAVFMTLGGLVSLTDRRHRVGAPVRSAHAVKAAAKA
ncbi:MAG TPA: heme lyase CcmF/NrfE family subunit [Alphaproteobacteria bacterium]|jgi:cytochrome c-type biogenesis protein CcmF